MSNLKDLVRDTCSPQVLPTSSEQSLDAEMREVVQKFEELYAELAPQVEEEKSASSDNIFHDFPREFPSAKESVEGLTPMTREGAKMETVRTLKPYVEAIGTGSKNNARQDESLGIEEAMSLLRAAEASGKAAAERAVRKTQNEPDPEAPQSSVETTPALLPARVPSPEPARHVAEPAAAQPNWSARPKRFWSVVLVVSSLALVVGTGLGYLMGQGHETTSVARIQTSPEGGARLRPDYELRER